MLCGQGDHVILLLFPNTSDCAVTSIPCTSKFLPNHHFLLLLVWCSHIFSLNLRIFHHIPQHSLHGIFKVPPKVELFPVCESGVATSTFVTWLCDLAIVEEHELGSSNFPATWVPTCYICIVRENRGLGGCTVYYV